MYTVTVSADPGFPHGVANISLGAPFEAPFKAGAPAMFSFEEKIVRCRGGSRFASKRWGQNYVSGVPALEARNIFVY